MDPIKIVSQIAAKKALIKSLEEDVENLYAVLPASTELGAHVFGDYILEVTPNKAFNAAQAKRVLSAEKYAALLVSKVDTTQAKKVLTGDEYEACQATRGNPRRTVKAVTDFE